MKAIANPVEVEYGVIEQILTEGYSASTMRVLVNWGKNSTSEFLDSGMMARYRAAIGDYYVIQSDGYRYVNPRDVFERKYRKAEMKVCVVACFQCGKPLKTESFVPGSEHVACGSRDLAFIPADKLIYGDAVTGKLYTMSGETIR